MPQLDIYIIVHSGIYLFIGFFMILYYIHNYILPGLGSLIKLRKKLIVVNKSKVSLNNLDYLNVAKYINK